MNQNKIANIFNNYFISIADTVNADSNKHMNTSVTTNTCGYNDISNRIIKLTAPFIIAPLTYICNAVLQYRGFSS